MQPNIIAINQDIATTNQSRISELLAAFIADQDVKESSKMLYKRTMKLYFIWVNARTLDMANITRVDILAYKEHLLVSGLAYQ